VLPDVSNEALVQALQRFDLDERGLDKWRGWETKGNFKHAINWNGKIYPVKRIVALATGVPESRFSGGDEANNFVHDRGFEVTPLHQADGIQFDRMVDTNSLASLMKRVCELQRDYSSQNTTSMQERGLILRTIIPAVLRRWLDPDGGLSVEGKDGTGLKTKVPWVRVYSRENSPSATQGIYLVYLFAFDGSSVSLSLNQGTTTNASGQFHAKDPEEVSRKVEWGRKMLSDANDARDLRPDIDLRNRGGLGEGYEKGNILALSYEAFDIPDDDRLRNDLHRMAFYLGKLYSALNGRDPAYLPTVTSESVEEPDPSPAGLTAFLMHALANSGFVYEPWQIATFVAAIRTKPFVILAGISGTGKTKLPLLAARSAGAKFQVIPVRPDWHDSGDLLGYTDLSGEFRSKSFLRFCAAACADRKTQYFAIIDEMNIARVEHYFAEVLSRIEDHSLGDECSQPLVESGGEGFEEFKGAGLSANFAIVGTVNMDESTHGFSRKVLDRAFTLELSEVDLTRILPIAKETPLASFGASAWRGPYRRLAEAVEGNSMNHELAYSIIADLQKINHQLGMAQLQIGFRSRDEIILFVVNAQVDIGYFVSSEGNPVAPLDLAVMMKILPRVAGSSHAVKRVLEGILELAVPGKSAQLILQDWQEANTPNAISQARWPRSAARACLMLQRLDDGYTSFFL